jgi:hypothetical protein
MDIGMTRPDACRNSGGLQWWTRTKYRCRRESRCSAAGGRLNVNVTPALSGVRMSSMLDGPQATSGLKSTPTGQRSSCLAPSAKSLETFSVRWNAGPTVLVGDARHRFNHHGCWSRLATLGRPTPRRSTIADPESDMTV